MINYSKIFDLHNNKDRNNFLKKENLGSLHFAILPHRYSFTCFRLTSRLHLISIMSWFIRIRTVSHDGFNSVGLDCYFIPEENCIFSVMTFACLRISFDSSSWSRRILFHTRTILRLPI